MSSNEAFVPAGSKLEAALRISALNGGPPEGLGPGSKERKSLLVNLARVLGIPIDSSIGKPDIGEAIALALGRPWDQGCWSAGQTITLTGLNRLLEGAEAEFRRRPGDSPETASSESPYRDTSPLVSGFTSRAVAPGVSIESGQHNMRANTAGDEKEESMIEERVDEARADLEWAVAEQLALLSQASDVPSEFEAPEGAFSAEDVDFSSTAWMSYLAIVQGWLRLPRPLELNRPVEFLELLVAGLGFDDHRDIEGTSDTPRLSDTALDRLRERAERAVQLQQAFIEDLETEGGGIPAATGRWKEAWEEEPEEEEYSTTPVTAKAQIWPIQEFSDKAERGKLNLSPSYQRGDVWPTKDSQMLIESILRGIPLPSVIVLKPQNQLEAPFEVVDGKQRLTSILRFIGRHPRALEIVEKANAEHEEVDLVALFQSDYPAFRKAWRNLRGEQLTASKEKEYYFPFKLRTDAKALQGSLSDLRGKYYTQIKSRPVEIADEQVEIRQIFERVSEYKIPVIEYSKASRRQIHEVFNLYNKQGKHLNAEEIRNAIYHNVDFMRALLVTAGDSNALHDVASFLTPSWAEISEIQEILTEYAFGTSRYRRTKVLSWLSALLLFDSQENGRPRLQSTARQIDSLLQRIEDDNGDLLRDPAKIRRALQLILQGMRAHAAITEAWDPKFKDTKQGTKWQELQLVGSLLGVTIAAAVLGTETEDRLEQSAGTLREKTGSREWRRPSKTQTATQWSYISTIALRTAEAMGVDTREASEVLIREFGYSGVETLKAAQRNGTMAQPT